MWIQTRQRAFYDEKDYDKRCEQDRLFSTDIAVLWLSVGVFFALLAFGLTGLDLLVTRQLIPLCPAACQMRLMERLAAGFLIGAFDITLIAVLEVIWTAGRTLKANGKANRIYYTNRRKTCLRKAVCVALVLVLAFSLLVCLLPAFIPLLQCRWLWLILCCLSLIIPLLILGITFKCTYCQRRSTDPCRLRDFMSRVCCKCSFCLINNPDP